MHGTALHWTIGEPIETYVSVRAQYVLNCRNSRIAGELQRRVARAGAFAFASKYHVYCRGEPRAAKSVSVAIHPWMAARLTCGGFRAHRLHHRCEPSDLFAGFGINRVLVCDPSSMDSSIAAGLPSLDNKNREAFPTARNQRVATTKGFHRAQRTRGT